MLVNIIVAICFYIFLRKTKGEIDNWISVGLFLTIFLGSVGLLIILIISIAYLFIWIIEKFASNK